MAKPALSIVTPTNGRPLLWKLTERWMKPALENYDGEVQWILADDGKVPTVCNLGQQHSRATMPSSPGINSFLTNMNRGLGEVIHDYVVIIEEDDWHHPDYLNKVMSLFTNSSIQLVGEAGAKYYHMPTLSYHIHRNMRHASWCQTAFRADLLDMVLEATTTCKNYLLDMLVWQMADNKGYRRNVKRVSEWTLGVKGIGGVGLGAGHKLGMYGRKDPYASILKKWIGEEDAQVYIDILKTRKFPVVPAAVPTVTRKQGKQGRWRR